MTGVSKLFHEGGSQWALRFETSINPRESWNPRRLFTSLRGEPENSRGRSPDRVRLDSAKMSLANPSDQYAEDFLTKAEQTMNLSFKPSVVFPGDDLTSTVTRNSKTIRIGPGLRQHGKAQVVTNSVGVLSYRPPSTYWVETSRRRYFPKDGDQVVGIIEEKGGDYYTVNIFSGFGCILSVLAFEGATKRNKPELKKGDLVYARIIGAHGTDSMETELSCLTNTGAKKEWSTGETVYGELPQGALIRVSTGKAKQLLRPDCVVLNSLGRHFAFEAAIGMNGAVWVRTSDPVDTVVISNAIINSELLDHVDGLQTEAMVEKLVKFSKSIKAANQQDEEDT